MVKTFDFNVLKYEHGVKRVTISVPAWFQTYFTGTAKHDRCDRQADKTGKQNSASANSRAEGKRLS